MAYNFGIGASAFVIACKYLQPFVNVFKADKVK